MRFFTGVVLFKYIAGVEAWGGGGWGGELRGCGWRNLKQLIDCERSRLLVVGGGFVRAGS